MTTYRLSTLLKHRSKCPNGGGSNCRPCVQMCDRPCWLSPDDAEAIAAAGLGDRLMLDYWEGDGVQPTIELLSAALKGFETKEAPWSPYGGCTFLTTNGLCQLHSRELKPLEGRVATCEDAEKVNGSDLHFSVAKLWQNRRGRAIIAAWKAQYLREDES